MYYTMVFPYPDNQGTTIKKGYWLSFKERLFQAFINGSSRLQRSETRDFDILVPHSSSVISATLRVDSPLTTISIRARMKACSLLWQRLKSSVENLPYAVEGLLKKCFQPG